MNPNYNRDPKTGVTCPFSQSMSDHAVNVWSKYISVPDYSNVHVVAHSAGGGCINDILREFKKTNFFKQVKQIAYTDSWVIDHSELTKEQQVFMFERAIHYVSSDLPVGKPISTSFKDNTCPVISAGHERHEYTTGFAQEEIFAQFKFKDYSQGKEEAKWFSYKFP